MHLIFFLILFPLIIGLMLLFTRAGRMSNYIMQFGALGIFVTTIALLLTTFHRGVTYIEFSTFLVDKVMFVTELVLGIFIFYLCVKSKNILPCVLITIQVILIAGFEVFFGHQAQATHAMFVDKLSILMAAVVGIVGSLICVYSTGYMQDFHKVHHKELGDRRNVFFFLIFIFQTVGNHCHTERTSSGDH